MRAEILSAGCEQRRQLHQKQIPNGGGASAGPPAMRCVPDEPRELGNGRAGAGGARAPPIAKVLAAGFGAPLNSAHLALLRSVIPVERLPGTQALDRRSYRYNVR